jgi:methylthioribulose-1-phosphate dehydratase
MPATMSRSAASESVPTQASFESAVQAIIDSGRRLEARGLAAATSGNFSVRLPGGRIAITVSGRHKGRLRPEDIMRVDLNGPPLEPQKPSAEMPLHLLLYRLYPRVHAVLRVHSVAGVVLSQHHPEASEIRLQGYEMLKAFPGIQTHAAAIDIPVVENSQDIPALARQVEARLQANPSVPAYLIRGHGAYAWGADLDEAERVVEALEHLLQCELETRRLRGVPT